MKDNIETQSCEFCYYRNFDEDAYPCSRCICNAPTKSMFRASDKFIEKLREVTEEFERGMDDGEMDS